ncbi:MAG: mycothiol synthase [Ilumatobacteraceae bacterium]
MQSAVITRRLTRRDVQSIEDLIRVAEMSRGYRPVSDQFWLDLHQGVDRDDADVGPDSNAQFIDEDGRLIAYAQARVVGPAWRLESVSRDDDHIAAAALAAVIDASLSDAASHGSTDAMWLVQGPTARHENIASSRALLVDRQLHQMRRSLPTGIAFQIDTRPFDPDRDVDEFVEVNARAFAWNPEQSSWTSASVHDRMREPWFDHAGFLIHEREGRMAGFCWTKTHDDDESPIGEIYVIAVDPDFHGLGLGRDLTLAGLDSIARRGISTGMLFVDAENVSAVRIYDRLGFVIHRTDTLFRGRIA